MGLKYALAGYFVDFAGYERLLRMIRDRIALKLAGDLGSDVRYGPLKGFKISEKRTWSTSDNLGKVLGLYEQPIQQAVCRHGPFTRGFFVGASDGFFAVGMLKAGLVQKSYCWEINPKSRAAILEIAQVNGVADRLQVFGKADEHMVKSVTEKAELLHSDLVLIDIDGDEFDLLTDEFLNSLGAAFVVIELHPFYRRNGIEAVNDLVQRASRKFKSSFLSDNNRDTSAVAELDALSDDVRYLVCSEGRPERMRWLVLEPPTGQPANPSPAV